MAQNDPNKNVKKTQGKSNNDVQAFRYKNFSTQYSGSNQPGPQSNQAGHHMMNNQARQTAHAAGLSQNFTVKSGNKRPAKA